MSLPQRISCLYMGSGFFYDGNSISMMDEFVQRLGQGEDSFWQFFGEQFLGGQVGFTSAEPDGTLFVTIQVAAKHLRNLSL